MTGVDSGASYVKRLLNTVQGLYRQVRMALRLRLDEGGFDLLVFETPFYSINLF